MIFLRAISLAITIILVILQLGTACFVTAADVPTDVLERYQDEVTTSALRFETEMLGAIDMDRPDQNTITLSNNQYARDLIRTSGPNTIEDAMDKRAFYQIDLTPYRDKVIRDVFLYIYMNEYKGGSSLFTYKVTSPWTYDTICYNNQPTYDKASEVKYYDGLKMNQYFKLPLTDYIEGDWVSVMLKATHPQDATYSNGTIKGYSCIGSTMRADNYTYYEIVYTDDYLPPKAEITKFQGDNVQGCTLEMDYAYYSYEQQPEAETGSEIAWMISDAEDGIYTPIPGATEKTLLLTDDMSDRYVKAAVTPKSADGVYMTGATVFSETAIGPIFGSQKIAELVETLNGYDTVAEIRNALTTHLNLFYVDLSALDETFGSDKVDAAITMLQKHEIKDNYDVQTTLHRCLLLDRLNNTPLSDMETVLKDPLFSLDTETYETIKNKEPLHKALHNRSFDDIDLFMQLWEESLPLYKFLEADRLDILSLLLKYDGMFDADLAALDESTLEKVGVKVMAATYDDFAGLKLAVAAAVTAADEEVEQEDDEREQGGSHGGSIGGFVGGGGGGNNVIHVATPAQPAQTPQPIDIETVNEAIAVSKGEFKDLDAAPWAKDEIISLAIKGVLSGVGDGYFEPNSSVKREEFSKMLAIAFSIPTDSSTAFEDVAADAWYAPYVGGLLKSGIITGIDATHFGVGNHITREEMATMVYRALKLFDKTFDPMQIVIFDDDAAISDFAYEAVSKMAYHGLISGVGNGLFAPKGLATRAMAAVMISNAANYMHGEGVEE